MDRTQLQFLLLLLLVYFVPLTVCLLSMTVEDVRVAKDWVRRLVFQQNRGLVQSECALSAPTKDGAHREPNHTSLSSEYHAAIIASFAFLVRLSTRRTILHMNSNLFGLVLLSLSASIGRSSRWLEGR